jgi:histone deacetylase 1/2
MAGASTAVIPSRLDGASSSTTAAPPPSMHHDSITRYIDFKLEATAGNFSKWRDLFHFVLFKYDIHGHIEAECEPLHESAQWRSDDITIVLWIYATISDDLYDVVRSPFNTAYSLWTQLHAYFDNQPGRAIHIGSEFRATVQGDLSIAAYCRQIKSLADALADVDEPVTDRSLTLQMIRGLNPHYHVLATIMPMQIPFPTFVQARSRLLLEEIMLNERERTEGSTALVVGNNNGGGQQPPPPNNGNQQQPPPNIGNDGGRGNGNGGGQNNGGQNTGGQNGGGNRNNQGQPQPGQQQQQPWMGYFAPWGAAFPPPGMRAPWVAPNAAGVLGPRPGAPHQAYPVAAPQQNWDQYSMLNAALNNISLQHPNAGEGWFMDTGASSHVSGTTSNLAKFTSSPVHSPQFITVGNGARIPIAGTGTALVGPNSSLSNILVSPSIIKNLISVRRFTRDNWCIVEFDQFGFSVKDLATRRTLMRSNSEGDFYPFSPASSSGGGAALSITTGDLWHRRLGHPGRSTLSRLSHQFLQCNKPLRPSLVCESCQLGRQPRLPFSSSTSSTSAPFQLVHCDLWTSPVCSFSGYQYYLIILDDYTHYSWSFPLRQKSDTSSTLHRFFTYVRTQFHVTIQCLQCDNGGEFLTTSLRTLFSELGVSFRLSCPHTSPQNGKAERLIRSTNDIMCTILLHAHMPTQFWVEALHTSTHLLNRRPSSSINKLHFFVYSALTRLMII